MDFLNLIDEEETPKTTEFDRQKFPPSLNRFMDIINEYDNSIYKVAFILDGDTISKSKYSFTCDVKDIIDMKDFKGKRTSIRESLNSYAESCDSNYDLTRLAMNEKIKNRLKSNQYTVLYVEMNEQEFVKNGETITYHKWETINKRKKNSNH